MIRKFSLILYLSIGHCFANGSMPGLDDLQTDNTNSDRYMNLLCQNQSARTNSACPAFLNARANPAPSHPPAPSPGPTDGLPALKEAGTTLNINADETRRRAALADRNVEETRKIQEDTERRIAAQSRSPLSDADRIRLDVFRETPDREKPSRSVRENIIDRMENPRMRELMDLKALAIAAELEQRRNRDDYLGALGNLVAMSGQVMNSAQKLESNKESGVSPASAVAPKTLTVAQGKDSDNKDPANIGEAIDLAVKAELEKTIGKDSKISEEKKSELRAELKKKLREKLRADLKKENALASAGGIINGDLTGPGARGPASLAADTAIEPSEKEKSPVMAALREQFSMRPSETEAEVNSLIAQHEGAQRDSADILGGILTIDSKSLFDRVRELHRKFNQQFLPRP